jgi:hypothetical protein
MEIGIDETENNETGRGKDRFKEPGGDEAGREVTGNKLQDTRNQMKRRHEARRK